MIDDAIVVVENIVLHRDSGEPRASAVRKALGEITTPLVGSTITPVVVFLPLVAVSGVTGSFFRALAITMTAALLTSLVLALTWTPGLSLVLLREHRDNEAPAAITQPAAFSAACPSHSPQGSRLVPGQAACGSEAHAFCWSWQRGQATRLLGSDLLPEMDEGGFILDYIMPAGSSLTETNRVLEHVDRILHATPEVESTSRRTGLQMGLAAVH